MLKPITEKSGRTLIYGKSSWKMQEDERARSLTGCCTATQIKLQVYEILMSHETTLNPKVPRFGLIQVGSI